MDSKRILVVEDERIVALDIARKLEKLGYDISAMVSSGKAALERVQRDHPDLVLMDIVLKGEMDGIQAAAQIQSTFDIPVVYLTAYADEKTLERAKDTEPFGYVIKPFDTKDLQVAVELALYKHEMETKLKKAYAGLEQRVRERTIELEEANTALRVLLKNRTADQNNLEKRLQANVDELIIPFITALRNCSHNEKSISYLNLLESNLNDIVAPFSTTLSSTFKNLTPKEIQIVSMIKNGKKSKEIAEILSVTTSTVIKHRENIRKKLNLVKGKTNLRSFLLSIP
jgi:DNA-binding NarL/FixJ family response regulator